MKQPPLDILADVTAIREFMPLDDDLIDHAEFSNPAYLVELMEVENIELFGVNLAGKPVAQSN